MSCARFSVIQSAIMIGLFSLLLSACGSEHTAAPVENISYQPRALQGAYRVQSGDTLYSIAWSAGLDYRGLALANNLRPPYKLYPGQALLMKAVTVKLQQPKLTHKYKLPKQQAVVYNTPIKAYKKPTHWSWPARGKIIARFSNSASGNKGLNIAGVYGERIHATAGGEVVYSGNGVRGYGNLLIIKHNNSYLSAYAFNERIVVKPGSWVKPGQVVATMGRNNSGKAMLHFEIRRNGKPVNPMPYLG